MVLSAHRLLCSLSVVFSHLFIFICAFMLKVSCRWLTEGDTFREQEAILRARCKSFSMQPWPIHTTVGAFSSTSYVPRMSEMLELAPVSLRTDSILHDLVIINGMLLLPRTVYYSRYKHYISNGSLFQSIKSHFLSWKKVKLIKANH